MSIFINNKKSTLYKGEYLPAQFYKGNKKITGYTEKTFSGQNLVMNGTYNNTNTLLKINGGYVPCKNLFDLSYLLDSGYIKIIDKPSGEFIFDKVSGIGSYNIPIICKPNTQYTLSYYFSATKEQTAILGIYYTDGTYSTVNAIGKIGEYVFSSGISDAGKTIKSIIFGGSGGLASGSKFKCIQLEEGSSYTKYSEHISPQYPILTWNGNLINIPYILLENNFIFADNSNVYLYKYNGNSFDETDISKTDFGQQLLNLKTIPKCTTASITEGSLEATVLISK